MKQLLYVYSWDPTRKKINEYTGYYYPAWPAPFLTREPGNFKTWFRRIPEHCGEFYGNAVWFLEPNPKKAQLVFIEAELKKIDACKETIRKGEENIRYLSSYTYEKEY